MGAALGGQPPGLPRARRRHGQADRGGTGAGSPPWHRPDRAVPGLLRGWIPGVCAGGAGAGSAQRKTPARRRRRRLLLGGADPRAAPAAAGLARDPPPARPNRGRRGTRSPARAASICGPRHRRAPGAPGPAAGEPRPGGRRADRHSLERASARAPHGVPWWWTGGWMG